MVIAGVYLTNLSRQQTQVAKGVPLECGESDIS
jgi:hypothetical protein